MQVQHHIRHTWAEVASLKFAVDSISFLMFLLLLGLLVPVESTTLDGLGDINAGRTCLVLGALSFVAWLLALLGQAIMTLMQKDARDRLFENIHPPVAYFVWRFSQKKIDIYANIQLVPLFIVLAMLALGITVVPLAFYWIWTRLIAPAVKDAPKPADIECAALVWQIALLAMELQEVVAVFLKGDVHKANLL
jgi:hypothetical protein